MIIRLKFYSQLLKILKLFPNKLSFPLAKRIFVRIRNCETPLFNLIRSGLLEIQGAKIGKLVVVKPGCFIDNPENLVIGNSVSIQHRCFISAYGGLIIGNDVSIAHDVSIVTSSHPYKNVEIIRNGQLQKAPVVIGDNVWIGMKAMIIGNVRIGSNIVIGAGSVVTKDVPDNSVCYGNPARVKGKVYE